LQNGIVALRPVYEWHLKEWHIAFSDVPKPNFIQKILKPGFRHCWAFTFDPHANVWLVYEPAWHNAVFRAIPPDMVNAFIDRARNEGPVLSVEVQSRPIKKGRIFVTCVSQICHLLGVDLFLATPYQLFCELQKNGAEERFKQILTQPEGTPDGNIQPSRPAETPRAVTSRA